MRNGQFKRLPSRTRRFSEGSKKVLSASQLSMYVHPLGWTARSLSSPSFLSLPIRYVALTEALLCPYRSSGAAPRKSNWAEEWKELETTFSDHSEIRGTISQIVERVLQPSHYNELLSWMKVSTICKVLQQNPGDSP